MEHFFKALRTGRICLAPFNKACLVVRNSYQHLIGDVLSEDRTESSYWMLQLAHILPFLRLSSRAVQRWQNLQSKHTVSLRTNMYEVTHLSGETKGTVLGIQRAEKHEDSLCDQYYAAETPLHSHASFLPMSSSLIFFSHLQSLEQEKLFPLSLSSLFFFPSHHSSSFPHFPEFAALFPLNFRMVALLKLPSCNYYKLLPQSVSCFERLIVWVLGAELWNVSEGRITKWQGQVTYRSFFHIFNCDPQ